MVDEAGYMGEEATKPTEIKTVFGRKIDVATILGADIDEILAINRDTLKVDCGDPNYEYGWMDVRDPACQVKLRKGMWELVTSETDPDIVAPGSMTQSDKTFRVNELVLVRMPKATYKKLRAAESAMALRRELAVKVEFMDKVKGFSAQVGGTGDPTFEVSETVVERKPQ